MRTFVYCVVCSVALFATGCMSVDIENHPKGMDKTASSPRGGIETIHGSFYGFYWRTRTQEDVIKAKGDIQLYRVTYHNNMLYSLVSVLTLGLYVPETIEWKLVTAPAEDGPIM